MGEEGGHPQDGLQSFVTLFLFNCSIIAKFCYFYFFSVFICHYFWHNYSIINSLDESDEIQIPKPFVHVVRIPDDEKIDEAPFDGVVSIPENDNLEDAIGHEDSGAAKGISNVKDDRRLYQVRNNTEFE